MIKLNPTSYSLRGSVKAPGDKSISHRAIILASLARGRTIIENFLHADDTYRTIEAFKQLGVNIRSEDRKIIVEGKGLMLKKPNQPLYFGNSGTTARLMLGVLAGQPFSSKVYGDPYLSQRPMSRVVRPLRVMGARIEGKEDGELLPLTIEGKPLKAMTYEIPVKSAQVKSALLLASLYAKGETSLIESGITRNHTENMLKTFGLHVEVKNKVITVEGKDLLGTNIFVPGDISSASFLIVAALIVPGSSLTIREVNLNETRSGILTVLDRMGASYDIKNKKTVNYERVGDITISYQTLQGTSIEGDLIPLLIDELPIIALLATQSEGETIIRDAKELRVKETDRIKATVDILQTLGANIRETSDGMIIKGKTPLTGGKVSTYSDHRMAMMATIASLICRGKVFLDEIESIHISYPNFMSDLQDLMK